MTILKRTLGVFTSIMCVFSFAMSPSQEEHTVYIVEGIVFAVITFLLFRPTKKDKEKTNAKRQRYNDSLNVCSMKHVNGLPIAENIECTIKSLPDSFEFSSGSMKFELEKSKITDMCMKTDQEIQQQYISSIGSAVGGAVLFGPLGAIIGGRAKKKTIKNEIHNYLIITYKSDEIKYIGFEIGFSVPSAKKFIDEFNTYSSETSVKL